MTEENMPIPELTNEEWLQDLCFLVDITEKLNQLNIELQNQNNLITDACNLIKAFQMKLLLFESQLKNNNAQHFPLLKEWQNNNFSKYSDEIRKLIVAFNCRFKELVNYEKAFEMFSSPFGVDASTVSETLQMELIDLQCNVELKNIYPTIPKIEFYSKYITATKFPNIRCFAQKIISAFGSTYVCKAFFSKMNYNKNKNRASITDVNLENQLRCATSTIEIDLEKLSKRKETQISH
jgi:hypothetical protein